MREHEALTGLRALHLPSEPQNFPGQSSCFLHSAHAELTHLPDTHCPSRVQCAVKASFNWQVLASVQNRPEGQCPSVLHCTHLAKSQ